MCRVDGAEHIDVVDARPVGGFKVPEGETTFTGIDADRKDDVAHGTQFIFDSGCSLLEGFKIGHVDLCRERPDSVRGGLTGNVFDGGVAIDDGDVRALFRKSLGDHSAHAVGPTDDDGDLSRKFQIHFCPLP